MTAHRSSRRSPAHSRRAVLGAGGAITTAFIAATHAAAQGATPVASGQGALFVQSFGSGSLFRTQGSGPDLPPYTLYLRDVVDTSVFVIARPAPTTGLVPTEHIPSLVTAGEAPVAALVARPGQSVPAGEETVWLLRLSFAGAGSDPGSLTYQGDLLSAHEAGSLLERPALAPPPDGEQGLDAGTLFLTGIPAPGLDPAVQLHLP